MCAKPKNLKDIDSFWDLNSLLPKKRPVFPTYGATNTDTAEISVDSDSTVQAGAPIPQRNDCPHLSGREQARRLNELPIRKRAEEYRSKPLDPYLIYKPESKLIKLVEVSAWSTRFNFYEKFLTDAKNLWNRTAEKTEHTPFFSYLPQYSQLSYSQMKWYLWWRENVRNSVYLKCDYCYILLYIYEILNCTEELEPRMGLEQLCNIWLNYRTDYKRLDRYMCEWLCDFCLIHKLPCPTLKLRPILSHITELATLKEFYMDFSDSVGLAETIVSCTSTYDWRKSRYITEENREIFSKHINGAAKAVAAQLLSESDQKNLFGTDFRVNRTSYESALCVYSAKRSITVEYTSYSRSPKFRFMATDIVKYSENRIRTHLGIRPRLKTDGLNDFIKQQLDLYFEKELPPMPKPSRKREDQFVENPYEHLYEPTSSSFSLKRALEIEEKSWNTTELLVDSLTDAEPESQKPSEIPVKAEKSEEYTDEFEALINSLDEVSIKLLGTLATEDLNTSAEITNLRSISTDALVNKINESAYDEIGDVIIELVEDGYRLVPDYKGEISKWLK